MRAPRPLTAMLVVLAMLTGCGDGEQRGDDGSPTTTVSGPMGKARAAVVQRADLPADWTILPEEARPDHDTTWRDLTNCLGLPDPSEFQAASASSPTYVTGMATQVSSTVAYAVDAARVDALVAALSTPGFRRCAEQAVGSDLQRNAPPEASVTDIQVAPLEFPKLGEATFASRGTATAKVGDAITIPVFTDLIVVLEDDVISRLTFINGGGPFPAALQRTLVETVAARA